MSDFGALTSGPQSEIHAEASGGVHPIFRSASTAFGPASQLSDEPNCSTHQVPMLWCRTMSDGPALFELSRAAA